MESQKKKKKWSRSYEILHLYCWNQHLPNHQAFPYIQLITKSVQFYL